MDNPSAARNILLGLLLSLSLVGCGQPFQASSVSEDQSSIAESLGIQGDLRVTLGEPEFFCEGSAPRSTRTEDGFSLSVLFDNLMAGAGAGFENPTVSRSDCFMRIPLQNVPAGLRVSIFNSDVRAFGSLPEGGSGEVSLRMALVNLNRPWIKPVEQEFRHEFTPGIDEEAQIATSTSLPVLQTPCDEPFDGQYLMQIQLSALVNSNENGETSFVQVESLDFVSAGGRGMPRRPRPGKYPIQLAVRSCDS